MQNNVKLFILDTNVLMHDPTSLFRFQEHDLYIPMCTLEELDDNKKGMSEVARNARQASRYIDQMIARSADDISQGIKIKDQSQNILGRLYLQTESIDHENMQGLSSSKVDNHIIAVTKHLQNENSNRRVILVSKDINMRIKARALQLDAEDYSSDIIIEDTDLLYVGCKYLSNTIWEKYSKNMTSSNGKHQTIYKIEGDFCQKFFRNEFLFTKNKDSIEARVIQVSKSAVSIQSINDYRNHSVWGIMARNREQNFALNLLLNPEIHLVTLLGQAGTGKTLLALAAGLESTLEKKLYTGIVVTRITLPVGEDIGFLPGTEEEKMTPWMGALEDNLEVLNEQGAHGGDWGRAATKDFVYSKIKIKSLSFMRGRTFLNKYVIIDEAQNLTPKQIKTLITRAGPGTKIVCLGNISQIDSPYITEGSSGITHVVDRFKGWEHFGHVTLQRGERSKLADQATQVL